MTAPGPDTNLLLLRALAGGTRVRPPRGFMGRAGRSPPTYPALSIKALDLTGRGVEPDVGAIQVAAYGRRVGYRLTSAWE